MTGSDAIRAAMDQAVWDGVFPGAVLAVRSNGEVRYHVSAGRLSIEPPGEPVHTSTIYDLASLTKPLATVTSIILLVQQGQLALSTSIGTLLEELAGTSIGSASLHDLLTHSSGLPGWRPHYERMENALGDLRLVDPFSARQAMLKLIGDEPLIYKRGERSLYSDLGFILLGLAIERVSGYSLDRYFSEMVAKPLQAHPLCFVPAASMSSESNDVLSMIAPTEYDERRGRLIRGEAHDENAAAMGGIAGHAGLFGTAEAVLAISGAWLRAYTNRPSILDGALVREFAKRQADVPQSSWALGWDTPTTPSSSGRYFSPESFGHLGYTGTSVWIDPKRELEMVLLSNRVHPSRKNEKIRAFRPVIHDLVYRELRNL
ncbi:serine hydrolase domain-containing protein [Petrachloros mirabilis]